MKRRTLARLGVVAAAAAVLAACAPEARLASITEIVTTQESFSTLATAVGAAGLAETLDGGGPYTVFAPDNSAFAALPPGALDDLLLPQNRDALVGVLQAHVVAGNVLAADLVGKVTEVTALDGTTFTIDGTDGVKISGGSGGVVTVTQPDVIAENGVIHVIDGVLLP